jgi:multicomponent Na+:H+ antiporter subunit E
MTYNILFELDENIIKLPRVWRFIWFGGVVFYHIVLSSIAHLKRILINDLDYLDFEITLETDNMVVLTMIANAITLTPGTVTLEIKGSTLHVLGFGKDKDDIQLMKEDIMKYYKPFSYYGR